ncbi:MAG TPA: sulfatase-like hydrolase/transferase [Bryobacteraceae bacterium]|jgi:choline-sulfatase|nr:sulfatase-like hydrolase/transferase [Bryobacteraceae bacterium]
MVRRRDVLKAAAAAPLVLRAQSRPLNLLFIMSDQHQREASGCYGSTEVRTPNIDRIAKRGARFDRVYCQAPVCVPSRGSMVTGVYPHTHGARILSDPLPAGARTIGHFFKERGYVTGAIGKMHFVDENLRHGFDHRLHIGDFQKTLTAEERQTLKKDQGGAEGTAGRPSKLDARFFQDNYYAAETVKFLRENRGRPFCLWSSFLMPHTPLVPMRKYFDLYAQAKLTLPRRDAHELEKGFPGHLIRARERGWYTQTDDELRRSLAGYYGNISQMDACVGQVYDTLRELGLDRNTVVVYTSDHGEMAGAHRMWTKHNMFEQSVAVPLIVSLPDGALAGESRKHLIEQIDLFPTLAELCGHTAPTGLPGRSFSSLMRNRRHQGREFAYSEYYFCSSVFTRDDRYLGKPPIQMVRTDQWKLNYLSWDRSELFDVASDPGEFHNRIDDTACAGIARELTAIARRLGSS